MNNIIFINCFLAILAFHFTLQLFDRVRYWYYYKYQRPTHLEMPRYTAPPSTIPGKIKEVIQHVHFMEYIDLSSTPTGLVLEWHQYNKEHLMSKKITINDELVVPYEDWLKFLQQRSDNA